MTKILITLEAEYELAPESYPPGWTIEQMIQHEKGRLRDPYTVIECFGEQMDPVIEVVED